jgi:hypothetical protein
VRGGHVNCSNSRRRAQVSDTTTESALLKTADALKVRQEALIVDDGTPRVVQDQRASRNRSTHLQRERHYGSVLHDQQRWKGVRKRVLAHLSAINADDCVIDDLPVGHERAVALAFEASRRVIALVARGVGVTRRCRHGRA